MKLKDLGKIFVWEILNPFLLKVKRNQKFKIEENIRGINLGCGIDNPPGWLGLDGGPTHFLVSRLPKFLLKPFFKGFAMSVNYSFNEYYDKVSKMKLIHHELKYGLPFSDNSARNIYSSHFIEHLFLKDAEIIFKECYRVLKKDGIIRICVPSLEYEVQSMRFAIEEYEKGNINPVQMYTTSDFFGYNSYYSNHRQMYNFEKLSQTLVNAGFSQIHQYDFKTGEIPDVELLDVRKDSLYVEGRKI
jgi:predicted SAM-dependent methyltransferase